MTTADLLKTAQNLPLHDPARVALLDAYGCIVSLKQALDYANAALLAAQTDRSNLLCACQRIGHGVGNAEDFKAIARAAIAGLCDRAAESVDSKIEQPEILVMRCATCKWRTLDGACINDEKIHEDDYEKRAETNDHLYYSYYEGGDFMVQPNFGCVHWAENDVDNQNRID